MVLTRGTDKPCQAGLADSTKSKLAQLHQRSLGNQLEGRPSLKPAQLIPHISPRSLCPQPTMAGHRRRSDFPPRICPRHLLQEPPETHACRHGHVNAAMTARLQDYSNDHMTSALPTSAWKRRRAPPGIDVFSFAAVVQTLRCTFFFFKAEKTVVKTTGVDPPHLRIIQSIKCHIGASPSVLENPIINIVIKHLCNLPWQHVGLVGCFPVLHGRGWYFHIKPSPVCSCFCVNR